MPRISSVKNMTIAKGPALQNASKYRVRYPSRSRSNNSSSNKSSTAPKKTYSTSQPLGSIDPFIQKIMADYENKFNEAKKSNEDRYDEGKYGHQSIYDDAKSRLDGLYKEIESGYAKGKSGALALAENQGITARKDISRTANSQRSRVHQDLVNSGLSGTTIKGSMDSGIARRESDSYTNLNEKLLQNKLNIHDKYSLNYLKDKAAIGQNTVNTLSRLGGNKINFIERREDSYPNQQNLMNFLAQYGKNKQGAGSSLASKGYGNKTFSINRADPSKIKKGNHTGFRRPRPMTKLSVPSRSRINSYGVQIPNAALSASTRSLAGGNVSKYGKVAYKPFSNYRR